MKPGETEKRRSKGRPAPFLGFSRFALPGYFFATAVGVGAAVGAVAAACACFTWRTRS